MKSISIKKKTSYTIIALVALVVIVISSLLFAQQAPNADAAKASDFDAGRIIDDAVFYNSSAMSASQIQNFLNAKNTYCDTNGTGMATDWNRSDITRATLASYIRNGTNGYKKNSAFHAPPYTCLKNFKQSTPQVEAASNLGCSAIPAHDSRTAAQIISDVSKSCGINPQVLVVLLEKEQSLVSDIWPLNNQYQRATGFDCPDNVGGYCDPAFAGFFRQVYSAAKQYKIYKAVPMDYNYTAGRTNNILWQVAPPGVANFLNKSGNPASARNGHCGYSQVYIQNQATAALYIYTPYRPNGAALNSYPGTGDGCSAYGNRNFWFMFTNWFGSTTYNSPFFRIGNSDDIYVLGANDTYYHVASWETMRAYGWGETYSTVVPQNSSFLTGKTSAGKLTTFARFEDNELYIIDKGLRRHISSREIITNYGLEIGDESKLPLSLLSHLKQAPSVQNIAINLSNGAIYQMADGKKRHFVDPNAYKSGNPRFSSLPRVDLTNEYLSTIPTSTPIFAPGTLVRIGKNDPVYIVSGSNSKSHVASRSMADEFGMNLGSARSVTQAVADTYQNKATLSHFIIKEENNGIRAVVDGDKVYAVPSSMASPAVYNLNRSNLITLNNSKLTRYSSKGSVTELIRIHGTAKVYKVENGAKRHITSSATLKRLGYTDKSVTDITKSFVNSIPTGSPIK